MCRKFTANATSPRSGVPTDMTRTLPSAFSTSIAEESRAASTGGRGAWGGAVLLARYQTGSGNSDPSRTTVGLGGDVVVADRFGNGATKIASEIGRCVDANKDGKIHTSSGALDVLPWGTDECVLWHVDFPQGAIARAAAYDAQVGPDGDDASTVWIGLYGLMQVRHVEQGFTRA